MASKGWKARQDLEPALLLQTFAQSKAKQKQQVHYSCPEMMLTGTPLAVMALQGSVAAELPVKMTVTCKAQCCFPTAF